MAKADQPGKQQKRCVACGRLFEVEASDSVFPDYPPRTSSFCQICEARIMKEAQDTQKSIKPM